MSPKKLAEKMCANYQQGTCSGIDILPDGSLTAITESRLCNGIPRVMEIAGTLCCVAEQRCYYFERLVIPYVTTTAKMHPDLPSMEKAVTTYWTKIAGKKNLQSCKRCHKPSPSLKANEKFCSKCKTKNTRDSWRKSKRRARCPKSEAVC
tara:strand:+ start:127 stop:576 length:450 start_codon:yes stop_codon:yes gene_type:complete